MQRSMHMDGELAIATEHASMQRSMPMGVQTPARNVPDQLDHEAPGSRLVDQRRGHMSSSFVNVTGTCWLSLTLICIITTAGGARTAHVRHVCTCLPIYLMKYWTYSLFSQKKKSKSNKLEYVIWNSLVQAASKRNSFSSMRSTMHAVANSPLLFFLFERSPLIYLFGRSSSSNRIL